MKKKTKIHVQITSSLCMTLQAYMSTYFSSASGELLSQTQYPVLCDPVP